MNLASAAPRGKRIAGSFRDPSGYVLEHDGQIFRAVDSPTFELLQPLLAAKPNARLVPTRVVADPALLATLRAQHPGFQHFLAHERVPLISYPYEWSYSMLADAADLTLQLQSELLAGGLSLKDASAYNVQFVQGQPIFIDLTSVEKPPRLDLWFALGQFQRMFLFPLLLYRHCGWDFRSYFLASLDGRSLAQVAQSLGWQRWRPSLWLDVALPLWFERKAQAPAPAQRQRLEQRGDNPLAQQLNLKRLRGKIAALKKSFAARSHWAAYTQTCTYDAAAEDSKKTSVAAWLKELAPASVLDLGCNTGDYSFLAARAGARVTAVDGDHDAIELLYRRLAQTPAQITPLVVDLANPSPAIGYLNLERSSWLERVQADCVLALALMHHLLVSANFSPAAMAEFFHTLTRRHLILEFVPPQDPMFERLLQFRRDLCQDLTLASCLAALEPKFKLLRQQPVPGTARTLLLLERQ